MKINKISYVIFLILISCNTKKSIKYNLFDMENTIKAGSILEINDKFNIKQNSIVAFRSPSSNDVKVLRVVGCPGDTLEIKSGEIYVNNNLMAKPFSSKKIYTVFMKNPSDFKKLSQYEFSIYSENYSMFSLSRDEYDNILKMKFADSIYTLPVNPNEVQKGILRNSNSKYANSYFFGPIIIPQKNFIIDDDILTMIPHYLSYDDLGKKINEEYYFCIGDNFPVAKDSRFIGLIPKSSIIGIVDKIQNVKAINVVN